MNESQIFDAYAAYYNLLNQGKDYYGECQYVLDLLGVNDKSLEILELGCGTGGHAICLAELGHRVRGVDLSASMLQMANEQKDTLPNAVQERLSFVQGDIRNYRDGKKYDAVLSLFHVISYQVENHDLQNSFSCAATHLREGGQFLFDFWHGPGVLRTLPEVRTKMIENKDFSVVRVSKPTLHPPKNRVDVCFSVNVSNLRDPQQIKQIEEVHTMRYLFIPEIYMLAERDFTVTTVRSWMGNKEPGLDDWLAVAVLVAKA